MVAVAVAVVVVATLLALNPTASRCPQLYLSILLPVVGVRVVWIKQNATVQEEEVVEVAVVEAMAAAELTAR